MTWKFIKPYLTRQGPTITDACWELYKFEIDFDDSYGLFYFRVYHDQATCEGKTARPYKEGYTKSIVRVDNGSIIVDGVPYDSLFDDNVITSLQPTPGLKMVLKTLLGGSDITDLP